MLCSALRSFVKKYRDTERTYSVHDLHFRLNCLLSMLVRLKPKIISGQLDFRGLDVRVFERNLLYSLRYAVAELCFYFKPLCKL